MVRPRRSLPTAALLTALALVCGVASSQVISRGDGSTTYIYVSDGDCFSSPFLCDPVGRGRSETVSDPLTIGSRNQYNGVRLDFSTPSSEGDSWFMDFMNEDFGADGDDSNDVELQVGTYGFAVSPEEDPTGVPRFAIARNPGTRCPTANFENDSSGDFEVTLVEYDQFGDPIRFAGTFDQTCFGFDGFGLHATTLSYQLNAVFGPTTLTPGNILVTFRNRVYEYANPPSTPDGQFQPAAANQVIPIRRPPGFPLPGVVDGSGAARELAFDGELSLHVYRDSSDPQLATLDLASGDWRNDTIIDMAPGGQIVAWRDYVYATDAGSGAAIVRFDKSDNYSATRFPMPEFYEDLTIGFDGRLYAAEEKLNTTKVDIYDPDTLAPLGTLSLDKPVGTLAVNALGQIFGAGTSNNGSIYRFDESGFAVDSNSVDFVTGIRDMALRRNGDIVVGDTLKGMAITDETLDDTTAYFLDFSGPGIHVEWIEPGTTGLGLDDFESGDTTAWTAASGEIAGILAVDAAAAQNGDFGLRVDVGTTCPDPVDNVLPGPTVSGLVKGCSQIIANDVAVVAPGAIFAYGNRIVLGEGFVAQADLETAPDPGLLTRLGWIEEELPSPGANYNAEFEVNLDNLTLDGADDIVLFAGIGENGEEEFRARLIRHEAMMENRLVLAARLDDGTYAETPMGEQILLPAGWRTMRFIWRAGDGLGYFLVSLDGLGFVGLPNLANGLRTVAAARLGATGGSIGAGTSGALWLDDFSSWR